MTRPEVEKQKVIIAGAGPVGLLLACELALAGVSPLVLEKNTSLADPWRDGALGFRLLNHSSTETFYRRGLLSRVIARELTPGETTLTGGKESATARVQQRRPGDFPIASHFAGIMIMSEKVDWSQWKHILPGPSAFGGGLKQGQLVEVLYERAKELGVDIRFGCEITGFEDSGTRVKVWTGASHSIGKSNGNTQTNDRISDGTVLEAEYLIGADGGRSFVRRQGGFVMEGTEATWTGYMAECELSELTKELLPPGFHRTAKGAYAARPPTTFVLDFDDSVARKGNTTREKRPDVTREGFESVLRRVTAMDKLTVESLHLGGSFTDRAKLVTEYRRGRILLAGDSAHIHSPLGGQGLNLGLAEALNLGWKVAAVVKGLARDELLDTYETERKPVAVDVLEMIRAHTSAIEPGLHGDAIFNLAKQAIATRDGATLFAGRLMWFHPKIDTGESCEHWLVGHSAPDFAFVDGTRLGSKMLEGNWVVVDFTRNGGIAGLVQGRENFVYSDSDAEEKLGVAVALIRPDGLVTWATDDDDESNVPKFKEAMARWLK